MIQVALDEQIFLLQRRGGISRYHIELMRNMCSVDPALTYVTRFEAVANDHALDLYPGRFRRSTGPVQPFPQLVRSFTRPAETSPVDLVHHTFYHPRFLRDHPRMPKVVTIHDMTPELHGVTGRYGGNPHFAKQEYVRRADLVICVSESTRVDLEAVYGPSDAPRVVIPHGVDDAFSRGGPPLPGLPGQYLLFVGSRGGYKQFTTLLSALNLARPAIGDVALVVVGGGPLDRRELEAARAAHMSGRLFHRTVSDMDLPRVFAHSAGFVLPSLYEGFGMPAIEAMAAGAPTVLARSSCLPEVGGDAARYFEPGDSESLAHVLHEVLCDSELRSSLIVKGRARAAQFTWQRTAAETSRAYRRILESTSTMGLAEPSVSSAVGNRTLLVIPTLGRRLGHLAQCLASTRNSLARPDIVLVGPESDDALRSLALAHDAALIDDPGGLSRSINEAIARHAKDHDFVMWLGDDDQLAVGALDGLIAALVARPLVTAAFGWCQYIDTGGKALWTSRAGALAPHLLGWGPNLVPQPGLLIRRSAWEEVGGLDESLRYAMDLDLLLRLQKIGSLHSVERIVSSFRWHEDSLTVSSRRASLAEARAVKRRHLPPWARKISPLWETPVEHATFWVAGRLNSKSGIAGRNA